MTGAAAPVDLPAIPPPPPETSDSQGSSKQLGIAAAQSAQALVGKVAGMLLGFAVNTVIAKSFGPKVLGEYSLVMAVINILSTLAVFGFEGGIVKYLPVQMRGEDPRMARGLILTSFITSFGLSSSAALILLALQEPLGALMFDEPGHAALIAAGALTVGPFALLTIQQTVLRVLHRLGLFVVVHDIGLRVVIIAGLVVLSAYGLESAALIMALNAAAGWMVVLFLLWMLRHQLPLNLEELRFAWSNDPSMAPLRKEYLAYCRRIILLTGTHITVMRLSLLILGALAPIEEVGIFRIASMIATLVTFVSSAASMVVPTFFAELYASKRLNELEDLLSASSKYVTIITLPVTVWLWFFGDAVLRVLGETYVQGHRALVILSFGNVVVGMLTGSNYLLRICGKERLVFLDTLVFGALSLALSALLIPSMGIDGAAWATTGALVIFNVLLVYHGWRWVGVHPLRRSFLQFPLSLVLLCTLGFAVEDMTTSLIGACLMSLPFLLVVAGVAYFFSDETDKALWAAVKKRAGR